MADFESHKIVQFSRRFLTLINQGKIKEFPDTDKILFNHILKNKVKEYDIIKLLDKIIINNIDILKKYNISYKSLSSQNIDINKSDKVFSDIDISIVGNDMNVLEVRLPWITRDKFDKLIKFFKEDLDMQFENRIDSDPVWYTVIRDVSIFDELMNNEVVKEIGYRIDMNAVEKSKKYLQENIKKQKELFKLSTTVNLGETSEFQGLFEKFYPFQKVSLEYSKHKNSILIADEMGLGKENSVDTQVFTPTGKMRMGDLQIGDKVIGSNGKYTNVIGVYPRGVKKLYRVYFNDGSSVLAGKEHLWCVSHPLKNDDSACWKIITTQQMMDKESVIEFKGIGYNSNKTYKTKTYFKDGKNNRWKIPIIKPVKFKRNDIIPIDPYLLGILLGDGSFRSNTIKLEVLKEDMDEFLNNISENFNENKSSLNMRCVSFPNLKQIIKELNLNNKYSYEKHIPDIYKYSSIENRLNILKGLMDTDGSAEKHSTEYSTTSKQLALDVQEIVNTLGGVAQLKERQTTFKYKGIKKQGRTSYRLNIKLPKEMNPFKLKRKADSYIVPTKYQVNRYITNIEYEKTDEAICIAVDAPDKLYATDYCILNHNTVQALGIMEYHNAYPAVCVVPANIRFNWKKEISKWIPHRTANIVDSNVMPLSDIYIISYNIVSKIGLRLSSKNLKMVVLDESHFIKSENSQRTVSVMRYFKKVPIRVLTTGTPILNRTIELVPQLNFLGILDTHFGGKRKFIKRYAPPSWNGWGTVYGSANTEELQAELRKSCMIRRLKKDVLSELPDKTQQVISLPLSDYKAYHRVEIDSINWYEEKLKQQKLSKVKIEEMVKEKLNTRSDFAEKMIKVEYLRQAAVTYKMDAVYEWVDNVLEQSDKLILFAYHRDIVEKLYDRYKNISVMLYGGMSAKVSDTVDKFINDKNIKLFIGSIASAGIGIDGLQNVCDKVAFVELAWTPAMMAQSADRVHRIGQKKFVNIYYLIGEETIESYIYSVVVEKEEIFEKTTNINKLFKWIKDKNKK